MKGAMNGMIACIRVIFTVNSVRFIGLYHHWSRDENFCNQTKCYPAELASDHYWVFDVVAFFLMIYRSVSNVNYFFYEVNNVEKR